LGQIQAQRQQQMQELQKLEQEIEQMRSIIDQVQRTIDHQVHEQEMKWQELQSLKQNLLSLRAVTAECWGQVNLYQEMLRPVQDNLDRLRNKLQAIATTLEQAQQPGDYQLEVITQIRQLFL
jgi:chromosome segregation ATPase